SRGGPARGCLPRGCPARGGPAEGCPARGGPARVRVPALPAVRRRPLPAARRTRNFRRKNRARKFRTFQHMGRLSKEDARMRFFHTADWHVGKTLKGRDRLEEQRAVLAEIASVAEAREVDAVLVAGDVYDQAAPTAAAQHLVVQTLLRIRRAGAQ